MADGLKDEGNQLLKERKFAKAIAKYTAAVETLPACARTAVYLSNRAMAHIKTEAFGQAIADAKQALEHDPEYIKAHYRMATAHVGLGEHEEALAQFEAVVKVEPKNKQAIVQLSTCREALRKKALDAAREKAKQEAEESAEEVRALGRAGDEESSSESSDEEQIQADLKLLYSHAGKDLKQARLEAASREAAQKKLPMAEEVGSDEEDGGSDDVPSLESDEDEEYVPEELRLIQEIQVDASYTGPHLPNDVRGKISLGFVKSLMQHFKDQKLLHRKYAMLLLYHVRMLLKDLPTLVDVKIPKAAYDPEEEGSSMTREDRFGDDDDDDDDDAPRLGHVRVCGDTHGQV
jgi:tetratricopeptide (TPR) repeat protein